MANYFPPNLPRVPSHALWSDLQIIYHEEESLWYFDDAGSTTLFNRSLTYVYMSFRMEDTILETPVHITHELTFHCIWNIHRHFQNPMPENLGRRQVGGIGRLYRRQFGLVYRRRSRGHGQREIPRD